MNYGRILNKLRRIEELIEEKNWAEAHTQLVHLKLQLEKQNEQEVPSKVNGNEAYTKAREPT